MTAQNLVLFKAIGAKMDYLNQRQRVIAQNISNSDTPGYRPQDLVKADFSSVLKEISRPGAGAAATPASVQLSLTQSGHISEEGQVQKAQEKKQKDTYEVAPAGNAVIIEEQLINSNQTVLDYNLMVNLMQKNMGLIKTALGRGQQ